MKKLILFSFVLFLAFAKNAEAKPKRYYSYTNNTHSSSHQGSYNNSTAQGVAETMARLGRVGHFGGNYGYEGCGSGSSPEAAYRNCCYANSGMATVDVGYAQGSGGRWYCCRRYSR